MIEKFTILLDSRDLLFVALCHILLIESALSDKRNAARDQHKKLFNARTATRKGCTTKAHTLYTTT